MHRHTRRDKVEIHKEIPTETHTVISKEILVEIHASTISTNLDIDIVIRIEMHRDMHSTQRLYRQPELKQFRSVQT